MANLSNRNTSKNTPQDSAAFKHGDAVLCPSMGLGLKHFVLQQSPHNKKTLMINCHGENFYFDADGFRVLTGEPHTLDYAPSLFHCTPTNRLSIAALYQCKDITTINATAPDDDEVAIVPSVLLSDIACDAVTAIETFNDLSTIIYMVINNNLSPNQITALMRMAYDSVGNRADAQADVINRLNKILALSKFGIAEVTE